MTATEREAFCQLARPGRRFVLTTHIHPDGDGIGSELALARFIAARGADVRIVNRDPVPETLLFLAGAEAIERYDPVLHDALLGAADVVVMLDNSDPRRLDSMEGAVRAARGHKVCVDHHPDPDPFWDLLLVRCDAACTGMLVHELFKRSGTPLDEPIATALYTALASDTGRFRFANTTSEAFTMAAELVQGGAAPGRIFSMLEERQTAGFLRLFGELLAGMELRCEGRVVLLRLTHRQLADRDAHGEDLSDVINQSLKLATSRVAALFRELGPAATKISLRSKGELDVNRLARLHGGGGHRNASGIVLPLALDDAIARLLPELESLAS